jgi:hypothetical protein
MKELSSPATELDRCNEAYPVPREGFPRPMPIFSLSLSLLPIEMEVSEIYDRFQGCKRGIPSLLRLYYMMPYFPGFL